MTEEELKNIKAPDQAAVTQKRKRLNTALFSIVGNIIFLGTAVGVTILIMLYVLARFTYQIQNIESDILRQIVSLWIPVIVGLACGFGLQHGLTFLIIHAFKLQDKLEDSFVAHYQKKK